jgi:hypothetical protein
MELADKAERIQAIYNTAIERAADRKFNKTQLSDKELRAAWTSMIIEILFLVDPDGAHKWRALNKKKQDYVVSKIESLTSFEEFKNHVLEYHNVTAPLRSLIDVVSQFPKRQKD